MKAGRELDVYVAEKVMNWKWWKWRPAEEWGYPPPASCLEEIQAGVRFLINPATPTTLMTPAIGDEPISAPYPWIPPRYSTEIDATVWVLDRLRAADIEVILGLFRDSFSIELRQRRDRRAEGIPGDPHTGRSRVTFYCRTGITQLAEGICLAAIDPEVLRILLPFRPD